MSLGISVCVITRNEEQNILPMLASLFPVSDDSIPIEILIVDNQSSDATTEKAAGFFGGSNKIPLKIIKMESNNLGAARARAIAASTKPIVAFIDADCRAPKNWIDFFANELASIKDERVIGVGGGNHAPLEHTKFHTALHICLGSYWGNFGSVQAKNFEENLEVSHLPTCNVFYFRERVLRAGNFSHEFSSVCEDLEFSTRARKQSFRFFYFPKNSVAHFHRMGLKNWAKKMFLYGWGQMAVARVHPEHLKGIKGAPLLAITFQLAGMLFFFKTILFLDGLYVFFTLFVSIKRCVAARRYSLVPQVFLLFVTTHVFYSLGELWGAVKLIKPKHQKMNQ